MNEVDFNVRKLTKRAFSQARSKLSAWAFIRLNAVAVKSFYEDAEFYVWHKMHVLVVDDSRLILPNHICFKEEFGVHSFGHKAGSSRSLAIGSMLYDVLNHITIDGAPAPYSGSEKDLLMEQMNKIEPGDLLLLDRGYHAFVFYFFCR